MKIKKVHALYDKYNKMYFKGELPFVDLAFVDMHEAFGWTFQEGKEVVIILIAKGLKNSYVRTTLLHEMIHVDQVRRGHKMDHGRKFKQIAKEICRAENIHYAKF